MQKYNSILSGVSKEAAYGGLSIGQELVSLLSLLEKINPSDQKYTFYLDSLVISYSLKLNILNFINTFPIRLKVRVIGLPISICEKGYFGSQENIEKMIHAMKGLKIVLNADSGFKKAGKTLSTFVFFNRFSSFDDYLQNMRSSYRRRMTKAMKKGKTIEVRAFHRKDFSEKHYDLYLSVMKRTSNPLETLPLEFFIQYDSELYEFIDKNSHQLLGFIQVKQMQEELYFLFCGFHKEDNEQYDLYYNMLLKIIQLGIDKKVKMIHFGQTSEESKLKIGCEEVEKYLFIHHSNFFINMILQSLVKRFSYKPYKVSHHVFKEYGI